MPFKASPITIPNAIYPFLLKYSKGKTLPAWQVQRAKIILLAADGISNLQISKQTGLSRNSVSKWRQRFLDALPLLEELIQIDSSNLENTLVSLLKDLPRPGHQRNFTDVQIIKILEIACRNPAEFGYESSHWSLNQLVKVTIDKGIVDSISAKTISRFLKEGQNPPPSHPLLASFHREGRQSRYLFPKGK